MLIDRVEVLFKAGKGGAGKSSFRRNQKGPDGGNGGQGGNIFAAASSDITLLNQFSREVEISAEDGVAGGKDRKSGRNGKDKTIYLPVGTSIIEKKTGRLIHELTKVKEVYLLAKGGKGGRGNWEFRSPTDTAPKFAEPGGKGAQKKVILSLKLIADFGLIGLPNAGKSSLLNELTNAKAQTANYEFTTLTPNLGVFEKWVLADIPGLIEGASTGRGLGTTFLKHIEKVSVLLHCISVESNNPLTAYETVRSELTKFSPEMINKKEIILVTKFDLADENKGKDIVSKLKAKSKDVFTISIHDFESIENLKKVLRQI
ncbi:MAG: GTPase ObgE [bacterium]|nr:GTPase ObgE [bacterium]